MGVLCKFFIWVIDVVCMVLLSGQPLTVMCAGLSSLLVLIVVFLVVCDRSNIHHARSCRRIIGVSFSRSCSIGHPPHSSASPVELRLRVGPHALSGKKNNLGNGG